MFLQTKEQIELDYQSSLELAAKRAADKARKEALENLEAKTEKAVRNMILRNYSDKEICEVLEVSRDYIARIRQELTEKE